MKNLYHLFYKKYFDGIPFDYLLERNSVVPDNVKNTIKKRNYELLRAELFEIPRNELVNNWISAKIAYPGLITGIGINHEVGIEGEFKLGMHFDFTYGMPVIYGSSIKGILRSAFPDEKDCQRTYISKEKQIREYLGTGFEEIDVARIRDVLFEGKAEDLIPVYSRDIFFDAVIISDVNSRILASDSITPHGNNPLKNPIPITFLKIASGATMEFRFRLTSSRINGHIVTDKIKRELFRKILEDFGVGAKTNVGYGQFSEVK